MHKLFLTSALSLFLLAAPAFAQQRSIYPGWQSPAGGVVAYPSQYQYACPQLYSNIERRSTDASSGGQVSALQQFLASYYHLDPAQIVVGVFGPLTQRYVMQFQRERGLSAVGIVGPYTRLEIQKICATQQYPTPVPPSAPYPGPYYPPVPPAPYYPPTSVVQPPALYSVSPMQGPVGTQILITGTDFTQDNTVHFGSGGAVHVPSYNFGKLIYFTVPSAVGPCSFLGDTSPIRCLAAAQQVVPGSYPVSVSNENGQTGSVNFTVTGIPPYLTPGYCTGTYCVN